MTKTLATLALFVGSVATAQSSPSLPTVTSIVVSANPTQGKPVTVTTTTTANGARVNGGNMTLTLGGVTMGTATINGSGQATFKGTPAVSGNEVLTATFNPRYGASSTSKIIAITAASGGCGQACGSTTPAPTFSVASGAVAPGTAVTPSCTGSGCVIFYSWTIDGSTPPNPSYGTGPNGDLYPIRGSGTFQYEPSYVPTWNIYGPINFKAIAHVTGQPDSAVASYSYTLTSPTGTPLSACGTIGSSGTYYLTGNLSSTGTCFLVAASGITLNGNGFNIAYGTGDGPVASGTNMTVSSSSLVVTTTTNTFTSAMATNHDRIYITQTSGACTNTGGLGCNFQGIISTYTSPTQVTITSNGSGPPTIVWSQSGATFAIYGPTPTFAINCDEKIGARCPNFTAYNLSFNQPISGSISPNSNGISIGNVSGFNGQSGGTLSNIAGNIYGPESMCEVFNYYDGGTSSAPVTNNTMEFSKCNDASTVIYNRDQIPGFPFEMQTGNDINFSSNGSRMHDLSVPLGSPQGCFATQATTMAVNLNCVAGPVQYVVGYGFFSSANGSTLVGLQATGNMRGIEVESANNTILYNQTNTTDATLVQDPNHNPPGCEIDGNYGFRIKDYSGSFNAITGLSAHDNWIQTNTGGCPGQAIRCTLCGSADGGTIGSNNAFVLNMATNVGPSSIYSVDQANMAGFTYSSNVYSITGTFASNGYAAYYSGSGGNNWTIPNLVSPHIFNGTTTPAAPSSLPTTGTFSGSGTMTCSHAGGGVSNSLTYNGTGVPCP